MDPIANIQEQIRLANAITAYYEDEPIAFHIIADLAADLAGLVRALHEWRESGGFDPYAERTAR